MPQTVYSEAEYQALCDELNIANTRLKAAEAMRPQWAMGHTSDSVAAQTKSVALQQVWDFLGVSDQTACMQALKLRVTRRVA